MKIIKKTKYISFIEADELVTKQPAYYVRNNKSQEDLGTIEYYFQWRQYCFYPWEGAVFNDECLREVILFLQELKKKGGS